jgi:hypothetical protein
MPVAARIKLSRSLALQPITSASCTAVADPTSCKRSGKAIAAIVDKTWARCLPPSS